MKLKLRLKSRFIIETVFIAGVYFLAAKLGLYAALPSSGGNVTLIWPPTGIAFAAIVFFGYRSWPALALGAFLANIFNDAPLTFDIITAIGNPLPAVAGFYLLTRFTSFDKSLSRLGDVCWFVVLPSLITTTLSASIGTLGLVFSGAIRR